MRVMVLIFPRLENSRNIESGPLLGLAAVRRYAAVHDIELSQARSMSSGNVYATTCRAHNASLLTPFWVSGCFPKITRHHVIQARVVSSLCSDLLGKRRETLLVTGGHSMKD